MGCVYGCQVERPGFLFTPTLSDFALRNIEESLVTLTPNFGYNQSTDQSKDKKN